MIESIQYSIVIPGCPNKVYRVNHKDGKTEFFSDENVPSRIIEFILEENTKAHDIGIGTIFKK